MKLRAKLMLCSAFVTFGSAALAVELPSGEVTRQAVEAAYASYESIEIKYGPTQVKVEAIDAETGQKVETIYDRASGVILKSEQSAYTGSVASGVEFKSLSEDFVDGPDTSDDDGLDDGTGPDDTSGSDDASASDDDGADDSSGGSDDGGSDSSGSDSDSNDSSGSDSGDDGDDGGDSSGGDDN